MGRGPIFDPKYQTRVLRIPANTTIPDGVAVKLRPTELTVVPIAAATDLVHGFLNGPETSFVNSDAKAKDVDVQIFREGGEAYALAGGTITKGAYLEINAAGRVVATNTANDKAVGYALEAATSGQIVRFNFTRIKI